MGVRSGKLKKNTNNTGFGNGLLAQMQQEFLEEKHIEMK
jgi:hypothetical protein